MAAICDDDFTTKLLNMIQAQLGSRSPITVAAAAFALGSAHRYLGALKTIRYFSFTVHIYIEREKERERAYNYSPIW